ncbi:nucleolar protein 11-like isoform X2 [Nelusetta ayraudi]|uniref:nucleolar protein 11-like isoform X2 n=1 Tax=Nelusetta ayraudi TaxID=303726 RepID=UPI003F729471
MAALFEGYTLCGLVPAQNLPRSGIQGVEAERDGDHVVVTDSTRSVTVYKVSDQKPLGSWSVRQGQTLTCPAVFNTKTQEYVAVSDLKVIRVWKEDDLLLDKTFRATVSSDVWRVHSVSGEEPVVLFHRGAVRLLDRLLEDPQQQVEDLLASDETIRWSTCLVAESQQMVVFTSEQKGETFLYLHRLNPSSLQKYRLERVEPGLPLLSCSASYQDKHIRLIYLYSSGQVYQSSVPLRNPGADRGAAAPSLPHSLLLRLPVGEGRLEAASAQVLDESHLAVVGVPHPSAGAGKDFLCIWNTNFQTLQAGKEMAGKIYGQLWTFSNKLFIPHGKTLSVIPYECLTSCLASALGKLKQDCKASSALVPSWNNILQGDKAPPPRTVETRKTRLSRKSQLAAPPTADQVLDVIKTAPLQEVQEAVGLLLSRSDPADLQPLAGLLASGLVSRSLAEPTFDTSSTLVQLVQSRSLSHSVCPDLVLMALERKDYFLCQLCLQFFPDIPEAVTCACLKAFISSPDDQLDRVTLEPDSVSFMEALLAKGRGQATMQNGFCPAALQGERADVPERGGATVRPGVEAHREKKSSTTPGLTCPVTLNKAVLLNEVLLTAYSDTFLLPHLKDLSSQEVVLFLQYLQFLYFHFSEDDSFQTLWVKSPSLSQILDWVCLLLDAHFTVLVMTPEVRGSLLSLHNFVKSQVRLVSELGKVQGGLQQLHRMKASQDVGQYSIEVIELF